MNSSKKFEIGRIRLGEKRSEPAVQMAWPSLGPKEYSSVFVEHLKETEATVLREAKEKALFIEKEAYEKGFSQGERDGLELGQKRVETVVQQVTNLLQEIRTRTEAIYQACEGEMLQLVLSISKKILHHELELNEEVILATLREVSKHIVDKRKTVLHLNPIDFQFLQTHSDTLSPMDKGGQGVEMIKDPSITRGGCLVETAFGDVDGRIETQFDQIVSLLWERYRESGQLSHREKT
jgi:flagellar assembly protein FliH